MEDEAEAAGAFADGREWTSSLRRMRDKLSSVPAMSEYSAHAECHARYALVVSAIKARMSLGEKPKYILAV